MVLIHQTQFGLDLEEHGICHLSTDSKHFNKRDFGPFFLLYDEKNYFTCIPYPYV